LIGTGQREARTGIISGEDQVTAAVVGCRYGAPELPRPEVPLMAASIELSEALAVIDTV